MRILYDFKSTQHFVGGCAEYIRTVFYTLYSEIHNKNVDVEIIGLVDSRIGRFSYADLSPTSLEKYGIKVVDIAKNSLKELLIKEQINKIFIGGAQYWGEYDIENITCPVVCIIHDLCDEEYDKNYLDDYFRLADFSEYIKFKYYKWKKSKQRLHQNRKIFKMLQDNKTAQIVTVSNYSKNSIVYNYKVNENNIKVLYSPERVTARKEFIENELLKHIVFTRRKYYLMLSANRINKNPYKTIDAFKHYHDLYDKDSLFVTVGFPKKLFDNHIILPYLSESDLSHLMEYCYAFVFPSYFEGFGYPPIEAMKYGKPVLCSNTTSIPEICGEAAIYFSPFYETDIFSAFCKLNKSNYKYYSYLSKYRYCDIKKRQDSDLMTLVNLILDK